jgi:hypothetical protein
VAAASPISSEDEWKTQRASWLQIVRERVIASWPSHEEAGELGVRLVDELTDGALRMRKYAFNSEPGMTLDFWVFSRVGDAKIKAVWMYCESEESWDRTQALVDALSAGKAREGKPFIRGVHVEGKTLHLDVVDPKDESEPEHYAMFAGEGEATVVLATRGVGPRAWPAANEIQIRRRFALLGQTVDGMRAFDIRRAMLAVAELEKLVRPDGFRLIGRRSSCEPVVVAALAGPGVNQVWLAQPGRSLEQNQALLGVSRELEMPQFLSLLYPTPLSIIDGPNRWQWLETLGKTLDPSLKWPYLPVQ